MYWIAKSFSIEKTLAVKPDLVILAQWQYEALAPDLPRLEQAGIPVVVVDKELLLLLLHSKFEYIQTHLSLRQRMLSAL